MKKQNTVPFQNRWEEVKRRVIDSLIRESIWVRWPGSRWGADGVQVNWRSDQRVRTGSESEKHQWDVRQPGREELGRLGVKYWENRCLTGVLGKVSQMDWLYWDREGKWQSSINVWFYWESEDKALVLLGQSGLCGLFCCQSFSKNQLRVLPAASL